MLTHLSYLHIPSAIGMGLALFLVFYLLKHKPGNHWGHLATLAVLVFIWCSGQFLWLSADNGEQLVAIARYQHIGINLLPASWCLFALAETTPGRVRPAWSTLFFIIPGITIALAFGYTPGESQYLWREFVFQPLASRVEHGPFFAIAALHNYILVSIGCLLFYAHYAQSPYYRIHLLATVLVPLLVLFSNFLYMTDNWLLNLDPTPTGFAFQLGIFVWAMRYGHFLTLSPFARHRAMDSIEDALFILDSQHRVVDVNRAAATLCGEQAHDFLGQPINTLLPMIPDALDHDLPAQVNWPDGRVMAVSAPTPADALDERQGRVIVIRDVSSQVRTYNLLAETREDLEHANRELDRIAHTDELTGLANRRMLQLRLEEEMARAKRKGEPMAVLFIDLDHFKAVNDRFGHLAGDEVLRRTAEQLMGHRKGFDIAARYGGEELVLVLTDTDRAGAEVVAKRLWQQLRELHHHSEEHSFQVTASIGIALLTPEDAPDTLLDRADQALYHAKRKGRDCIYISGENGCQRVDGATNQKPVERRAP